MTANNTSENALVLQLRALGEANYAYADEADAEITKLRANADEWRRKNTIANNNIAELCTAVNALCNDLGAMPTLSNEITPTLSEVLQRVKRMLEGKPTAVHMEVDMRKQGHLLALMKFYNVATTYDLVTAQYRHIAKLQEVIQTGDDGRPKVSRV